MSKLEGKDICLLSKGSQVRVLSGAPLNPTESTHAEAATGAADKANNLETEEELRKPADPAEIRANLFRASSRYTSLRSYVSGMTAQEYPSILPEVCAAADLIADQAKKIEQLRAALWQARKAVKYVSDHYKPFRAELAVIDAALVETE